MRILAFESTAVSASVALMEDERLVGEFFINTKLTHSRTLMPMAASLLQASGVSLQDIDYFAVAHGPGSFTGVRIGVATVKGLAAPNDVPCCPVSSLLSMAYNLQNMEGVVCAVMDARCHQVYNALFRVHDGVITRLCEDRAIEINQLAEECRPFGNELILVGDGASLCYHDPAGAFRDMGAVWPLKTSVSSALLPLPQRHVHRSRPGMFVRPPRLLLCICGFRRQNGN